MPPFFSRLPTIISQLLYFFLLASCVSPSKDFEQVATQYDFQHETFHGAIFDLHIFRNTRPSHHETINIYIGGDGTPWITPTHISIDPTPRNPLALRLMSLDTNAAIYIGRPCYHSSGQGRNCHNKWWTSHRYAKTVVQALSEAVNQLTREYQQINVIGFSGGGTLAMLLSMHIQKPQNIITINANLDIDHWAKQHNYTPLYASLNPINQHTNFNNKTYWHFFGGADNNIDYRHIIQQLPKHPNVKVRIQPEYDHHCCWPVIWPSILKDIN